MKIVLKLFGNLQAYHPVSIKENSALIDVLEGSYVRDVLTMLGLPQTEQLVVLINGIGSFPDQQLQDGDVVAIFQSIAGGAGLETNNFN